MNILFMLIRYALIGGGQWLAYKGYIPKETSPDSIVDVVEQIMPIVGNILTGGGVIWGLIIGLRTKPVPNAVAQRLDVPTASPITGNKEEPTKIVGKQKAA